MLILMFSFTLVSILRFVLSCRCMSVVLAHTRARTRILHLCVTHYVTIARSVPIIIPTPSLR